MFSSFCLCSVLNSVLKSLEINNFYVLLKNLIYSYFFQFGGLVFKNKYFESFYVYILLISPALDIFFYFTHTFFTTTLINVLHFYFLFSDIQYNWLQLIYPALFTQKKQKGKSKKCSHHFCFLFLNEWDHIKIIVSVN